MKIAVLGLRGVPATFGGIEKHCEELYSRLVNMGHEVTIYARKGYITENIQEFKGMKIKTLRTINSKHFETIFHTFWAVLHAIFSDADIIHFHAQGPCLVAWIPKIFAPKKKLIFTCHGLDWQRNKWNFIAKNLLFLGEIFSAKLFNMQIMVSEALLKYYRNKYNVSPVFMTNGTNINSVLPAKAIKEKFNLDKDQYILFIGRLVPEKAPHKLIESYKNITTDKKLVIVGGSSSTDNYETYLKELAKDDDRVIFTSYLYNDDLVEIYSNAYLYISASELEGLPLTLLEAMSYGIPAVVSPIDPHIEVIGKQEQYGYLFDSHEVKDINNKLQLLLTKSKSDLVNKGLKGQEKIKIQHKWKNIAKKMEIAYKFVYST